MTPISATDAKNRSWDVVIAGSSFASMFFLYGLPKNLSVLVIEKGQKTDHHALLEDPRRAPYESFASNSDKPWIARTAFGGNSNCWWGQTPRFHPSDFATKSRFGQAEDWPFGYDTLEPFYHEVETVMEIAGGGSEHILPRSQPFPFPPHTPSRSDMTLQASDPLWVPVPTARSNGGSRPICCSNGICDRCPIDSKFTILNGIGHFEREGCFLLSDHEVREVTVEAGVAKSVAVKGSTQSFEISANLIALGTNAIFNAAILMRSGFTSPALGRYLHEQVGYILMVDAPIKNFFGGTSITGHGYHFYHDFDRTERAAVLVENFNSPPRTRETKNRWTERLILKLVAEDVPNSENRVELKDGEVMINWSGHSAYARQGIDYGLSNLDKLIPVEIEDVIHHREASTEAHILGTTRMGKSAQTSVVDDTLKTHEISNVISLGAGAFPSCSPANPTLTLSALSVRAARSL